MLSALLNDGVPIESVEIKVQSASQIEEVSNQAPTNLDKYFELAASPIEPEILKAISSAGARVKLRMGGVTAEAFPLTPTVVDRKSVV